MLCGLLSLLPCSELRAAQDNFDLTAGGARLEIVVGRGRLQVTQSQLMGWVQRAANSVVAFYGRFPVPHVRVQIKPFEGQGVQNGVTFQDHDGGLIKIRLGSETTEMELLSDWTMTHEMVHLAFPSVSDEHHWIEEGIATYVEPIARVRAGYFDAKQMWFELVRDLPKGLPLPGDQGLDYTHTWGRTYWGGALFCFLADVEIRRQTQNKKGLVDALRGILDAGGDIRKDWELRDALRVGDQAVGVKVLTSLYEKMGDKAMPVNLEAMWKELGIESRPDSIVFLNSAPLADVRRAIASAGPEGSRK
jgi:hypothetical protein